MSTRRRGATSTDDSAAATPPNEFTQRGGGRTKRGGLQSPTEPAILGSPPTVQPNPSIMAAAAKDSRRRSGRHAENETNQCPYCDYTDQHNFSMLAHVRNEHPGLKWIKKEVDPEAPRAPIVETLHVSDVAGPSSSSPQQQPPQAPRMKGRKAKVTEILPTSPSREEPAPKKRGRQPKKPEIDFMNVEDVVAEEIINTVEEEIIIPDEIDDPGSTYIMEGAEMKEDSIPIGKRRQIHALPPDDESDKKHMSHQILRSPIRGPLPRRPHDAVLLDPQVAMPNLDVSVDKNPYGGVNIGDSLQRTYMEEQILSENDEYIEEPPHLDKNLRRGAPGTYAPTYDSMMNLDVEVQIEEVEYSSGAEFDEIDVEGQHDELYEDNKHLMYRSAMGQNVPRTRPSRHNPLGDPNGRYPCYIEGCKWRGNFRSVRCTHMRNVHPDWVRPPRFVLNRIARDGTVLPANDVNARYSCFIDGCPWRGNYRASRSNHMKTQHKGWVPKRTRAANGGYVANGRYHCHVEECGWRGMSRSTRAVHMRREHPGFVNPIYTPRNIPCTDCGSSMTSHKLFVDHMVVEHKIGGIVQREFSDVRDYEDWFEAVQESFSIDFIKKMGVKNGPNYQILYLYCARSGGYCPARGYDKKLDPMGLYEPRHAKHFRRRDKCGRNCAAFLRVMHWNDGRLSIIGCVEHTGHRLGTALLRLSPIEREAMDEYLYMMEENTPLDLIIDRLREIEGLSAAGYEPRLRPVDFVRQFVMDGDERKSLNVLLNNLEFFPEDSSFGIVPPPEDQYALSVGWMDSQMKELWKEYAHKGVCLEEVRLMLGEWDLRVMLVIVLDMNQNPRIAALYISNSSDKRPLMDHITSIWSGEVATFVTDYSSEYPDLLERYFGHFSEGELDLQFAEWHLLSEWAATIDQLVMNRVDKYGIICVLRRLLRTTDSAVFDQTINELFDGLREMQLDEVAQYVDDQLDPIFLKRWSPSGRNPLTEHNNPTLEFACRMLRERFIACEQCTRIDEYVGFLIQRIREFNESELSAIYATRESDPPRELPQHYMELALEGCELGGSVVRHELDDEEGETWADFGQRANSIQGIHPRFNQIELSYDKSRIVDMEASGSGQNGAKPPGMELLYDKKNDGRMDELVEEIVEEEVVPFEQAELLNQMVQEGEFVGDDEDYSQSSGGRPEGKRQRLLNMMSALQHRLEHLADDECIELVEGSIEQVVNKLQTATPKK